MTENTNEDLPKENRKRAYVYERNIILVMILKKKKLLMKIKKNQIIVK